MTLLTTLCSPHRREAMGVPKFVLAHALFIVVPLAGVFLVRSGFRHAYLAEGRNWWDAMWLSLLWMTAFIAVGQAVVRYVPPMSWLVRDLRRVGNEMWKRRFRRLLGMDRR